MQINIDCLPCFMKQVIDASRMATDDIELQKKIIKETAQLISEYEKYKYAPSIGREMHKLVKKFTKNSDPYREIKDKNIKASLTAYPALKEFLSNKKDKLYWALKVSALGNMIDSAIFKDIDIEGNLKKEINIQFAICDISMFKELIKKGKSLLIIGDNAGETVFDRVFIEEVIDLDITYAVRSEPVINDATIEDVYASGFDSRIKVISSGCSAPGTIIEECSDEFLNVYKNADIVLSKGQGNFETLSDVEREVFFLLKAKCPIVAERIGVNVGDCVLKSNKR